MFEGSIYLNAILGRNAIVAARQRKWYYVISKQKAQRCSSSCSQVETLSPQPTLGISKQAHRLFVVSKEQPLCKSGSRNDIQCGKKRTHPVLSLYVEPSSTVSFMTFGFNVLKSYWVCTERRFLLMQSPCNNWFCYSEIYIPSSSVLQNGLSIVGNHDAANCRSGNCLIQLPCCLNVLYSQGSEALFSVVILRMSNTFVIKMIVVLGRVSIYVSATNGFTQFLTLLSETVRHLHVIFRA